MEKKTIGQFIAVLRKANGMTQQDLADRLNVSNKAVSRWERDESAPDITLIPALAELLGVTCDELLKGERITYSENVEKREVKVEKQVKALIHREITKYKTMMWIAAAFSIVGAIIMLILENILFGLKDACFAVMLLFEVVAFAIVTIAVTKMRDAKTDSEVFENADATLIQKYNKCLGDFSFWVYFLIVAIISGVYINNPYTLMLPYITAFVVWLLLCAAVYLWGKNRYVSWITGTENKERELVQNAVDAEKLKAMNRIQIGAVILVGVLYFFAPYFETSSKDALPEQIAFVVSVVLIVVNVLTPIIFAIKEKDARKQFLFYGLRNICLIPSGLFLTNIHKMGWTYNDEMELVPYDQWDWSGLTYAICWGLALVTLFKFINHVRK